MQVRHGHSRTRLYRIWVSMKSRCLQPSSGNYRHYGGRGIGVYPEWASDFQAFRTWAVSNGYGDDLWLDRKKSSGNYEPNNCRWATSQQQARNRRKGRLASGTSRFKGVSRSGRRWRALLDSGSGPKHIGTFDSELRAAFAYDDAAFHLDGEFACVNFPERIPRLRERMVSLVGDQSKTK